MPAFVQTVIIAVIVAFSVAQLIRTLFPKTARAWSGQAAALLCREASPPMLRHVGVWLTPKDAAGGDGCGSGSCNSCKACATFTFDPAAEPAPPVVR